MPPSEHPGWQRSLWLMIAVRTTMSVALSISYPFLPFFVIQLGVTNTAQVAIWSGILSSVNFLGSAIFSPIWGGLSDRFGRKVMVIRSSIASCVFLALTAVCQNVWQLLAITIVMGIFAGFSAASMALVATQVPEERLGFSLGWLATAETSGSLIGPLIGGGIADALHNYRLVYLASAVVSLVVAVTATLFVKEQFQRRAPGTKERSGWHETLVLLRHPAFIPLLTVLVMTQFAIRAASPIIPLYVRSFVGDAPWLGLAAGGAIAVTGIADLLASPWLGKRSDQLGYFRVLIISLIGAAVFTLPQAFAPNYGWFIFLRFGVGVFVGGILPCANALIGRLFPREVRGRVFGLIASATFVGMFGGPLSGGLIGARFGFSTLFIVVGCLMLASLGLVLALRGGVKPQLATGHGGPTPSRAR